MYVLFCLVVFLLLISSCVIFFFSSRSRHTRCALVTGVQTCALPISRGHGFARIDPEIAIHMLAVRPARADRRDDRHPVREGERIREAGIRHYAPGAPRHGLRGADREGQLVELEVGKEPASGSRSEEHTSELQSLMRISYAVFCLN